MELFQSLSQHIISGKKMQKELSIRSESVQRVYNFYRNSMLLVNRRYQRKLIWTIEEKKSFIDSIIKGYPVPLFLLAEVEYDGKPSYEIIDGMQRLNAIVSFIEGEYDIDGFFFDTNTMVESKSALDTGDITQKEPLLDRKKCESFSSYVLPLSVYSFDDNSKVDEIFRRINANGKHLSRQELRSAGTLGVFSDIVRQISSTIRTDVSSSNVLLLNNMKMISITNQNLNYGISVDDLFWVKYNIITKEMVRESRDEALVADILAYMSLDECPPSSSDVLDQFYGFKNGEKHQDIELALKKIRPENLISQFIFVYDELRKILTLGGKTFSNLLFGKEEKSLPRYFTVVFLAFFDLLIRESKRIIDYEGVIHDLEGAGNNIDISTGGNWSAKNKESNINAVCGLVRKRFTEKSVDDPGAQKWLTEFETILMQSKTEQSLYDFKQGFTVLDGSNKFDDRSFSKIIKTLTAMANKSRHASGYVCVGVADNDNDAQRIETIYRTEGVYYRGYNIFGIGHEAIAQKKTLDDYFKTIVNKIESQPIDKETIDSISRNIRLISYHDKDVIIFKLDAGSHPRAYEGKYYRRFGANNNEVSSEEYPIFFTSY